MLTHLVIHSNFDLLKSKIKSGECSTHFLSQENDPSPLPAMRSNHFDNREDCNNAKYVATLSSLLCGKQLFVPRLPLPHDI